MGFYKYSFINNTLMKNGGSTAVFATNGSSVDFDAIDSGPQRQSQRSPT
jgi:hypothetical protein